MKRTLIIVALGMVLTLLAGVIYRGLSCRGPAEVDSGNRVVMGTFSRVIVIAHSERAAKRCVEAAFQVQLHIEGLMSYQREDSELSRVNREAADRTVRVNPLTFDILQKAAEFSKLSGGAFDVTVGPLMDLWKAAEKANEPPTRAALAEARSKVSFEKLILNEKDRSVRFAVRGMKIDLGGIGKGFAVDKSVEAMKQAGALGGMVDLGGNIRCFGQPPHGWKTWQVGLQERVKEDQDDLSDSRILFILALTEQSVATSGSYRRFVKVQGTKQSHVMDASIGEGANKLSSDTVIAPDATTADVLSTAVNVLGLEKGLALVERLPGVEAILIPLSQAGEPIFSAGAKGYLKSDPQ